MHDLLNVGSYDETLAGHLEDLLDISEARAPQHSDVRKA
jgi:hypothetical protein